MNDPRTRKKRWAAAALAGFLAAGAWGGAGAGISEDNLASLTEHFEPRKPTVILHYEMAFRLLFLELMQVAEARIEATEGLWTNTRTGEKTPACFIHLHLFSPHYDDPDREERVQINNRVLSVVTMPEMDTLVYSKRTEERINPFFKKPTEYRNVHIYDLQDGEMSFYTRNFLTGEVSTNLDAAADFAGQGKEVATVLEMMSDIYYGRRRMISPDSDFRIHVNIEGTAIPYAADTEIDETPAEILGERRKALRVVIEPAREAPRGVKKKKFMLWTAPLCDLAEIADHDVLRELACAAPRWGMAPLVANFGLSLGYIRGTLTAIEVENQTEGGLAPIPSAEIEVVTRGAGQL
jgi:hypothetical protein